MVCLVGLRVGNENGNPSGFGNGNGKALPFPCLATTWIYMGMEWLITIPMFGCNTDLHGNGMADYHSHVWL